MTKHEKSGPIIKKEKTDGSIIDGINENSRHYIATEKPLFYFIGINM